MNFSRKCRLHHLDILLKHFPSLDRPRTTLTGGIRCSSRRVSSMARGEGEGGEVATWATSTCTMTNGKQVTTVLFRSAYMLSSFLTGRTMHKWVGKPVSR